MVVRGRRIDSPEQCTDTSCQVLSADGPNLIEIDARQLAPIDLQAGARASTHCYNVHPRRNPSNLTIHSSPATPVGFRRR
jgi:hypothetical protein